MPLTKRSPPQPGGQLPSVLLGQTSLRNQGSLQVVTDLMQENAMDGLS